MSVIFIQMRELILKGNEKFFIIMQNYLLLIYLARNMSSKRN